MSETTYEFYDPDLSTAAVERLRTYPPFVEMVLGDVIGTDVADDASPEEKLRQAWLFQGLNSEGRPFRDPEGSGKCIVVLSERREWATANQHNTAGFPALQVLIYADSTRDSDPDSPSYGAPLIRDADRKCKHIFNRLDRLFHNPANRREDQSWDFIDRFEHPDGVTADDTKPQRIYVHSTLRGSAFTIGDVPGTNEYTVRGEVTYNAITD